MTLTREKLQGDWLRQYLREADPTIRCLTDEELDATRRAFLERLAPGDDLWLFAYGSLLWNPCFQAAECQTAQLSGWHRRFCFWTPRGRGTPERPGLMLGLEPGGSCGGLACRVAGSSVACELDLLWRREMVTGAYVPRWVDLCTEAGTVPALTFTSNQAYERYAGRLEDEAVIEVLALAEGPLGSNRDYLFATVDQLERLGIPDPSLCRLAAAVRARLSASG